MPDVVSAERRAGRRLVRLHGELDLQSEPELRAGLSALPDRGDHVLVLGLATVTFLDCSAVNLLLGLARRCAAGGVGLLVADAPGRVRRVLVALDLDHAFTLVRDGPEALALASLWDGGPVPADPQSPLALAGRRVGCARDGRPHER